MTDIDPVILGDLIDPTTFGNPVVNELNSRGAVLYLSKTNQQTGIVGTTVDISGLGGTFQATSTRLYRTSLLCEITSTVANDIPVLSITDSGGSALQRATGGLMIAGAALTFSLFVLETGLSGTITRKARCVRALGTGSLSAGGASTFPAVLMVEDLGPA